MRKEVLTRSTVGGGRTRAMAPGVWEKGDAPGRENVGGRTARGSQGVSGRAPFSSLSSRLSFFCALRSLGRPSPPTHARLCRCPTQPVPGVAWPPSPRGQAGDEGGGPAGGHAARAPISRRSVAAAPLLSLFILSLLSLSPSNSQGQLVQERLVHAHSRHKQQPHLLQGDGVHIVEVAQPLRGGRRENDLVIALPLQPAPRD